MSDQDFKAGKGGSYEMQPDGSLKLLERTKQVGEAEEVAASGSFAPAPAKKVPGAPEAPAK